jgi:hypothetical protein
MTARLGAFASSSGERGAPPLLLQRRHRGLLIVLGLFGAGLLYGGDGVITPAISVLSAAEGLEVATPAFKPYVLPSTLLIVFGPIMPCVTNGDALLRPRLVPFQLFAPRKAPCTSFVDRFSINKLERH